MVTNAIVLEDVSLCYRLAKQRIPSLKEYAIHWLKGALRYETLWALRNVSFSVPVGEKLGLIGPNGAGKSSLLKVISRILVPSGGRVQVIGRVAPILELGTGFDFELTGRENIFLNALLLGHTRREVQAHEDEIIDFCELGEFIDSPIRTYSTGMLARLGFSIATTWKPDVLILDEVMAVGDTHFRAKSQKRLTALHDQGTTLLMVSHEPRVIRELCTRCIWLDRGIVRGNGPADEVVEAYETASAA